MYWNQSSIAITDIDFRLTLTWDVLKSNIVKDNYSMQFWLTLTWDVLKWTLLMLC